MKRPIQMEHVKLKGSMAGDGYRIIHGDHYVADVYGNAAEELTQLFLAAPEMLEALKQTEVMLILDGHTTRNSLTDETPILRMVRTAIAKATGDGGDRRVWCSEDEKMGK